MNERIKELARQSGLIQYDTDSKLVDAEKFAELIVKECMDICKQHPSRIVSNNWNAGAVAPHLVKEFKEHFGVEE